MKSDWPIVVNLTGIRQKFVRENVVLPPGLEVAVPPKLAERLSNDPKYRVVSRRGKWIDENGQIHLHFMAPINAVDGYGSQAIDLITSFSRLPNVLLTARNLWDINTFGLPEDVYNIVRRPLTDNCLVGLSFATAGEFDKLPTEYRVGLTMYEATDPRTRHPEWTWQINNIDLLLTPSEWCGVMWREADVYTPIKVVDLGAGYAFHEVPLSRRRDTDEFVVVSWGTMSVRKSPLETIEVFQRAFPPRKYPKCRLKIKTRCHLCGSLEGVMPELRDTRIEVIDEDWLPQQMVSFARGADVALNLSKGEGHGRPLREAMAVGLPVIAAYHTGHISMLDQYPNVSRVNVKKEELSPLGGMWYLPDLDEAIDHLRWHYDHREESMRLARETAERYRDEYSPDKVALGIIEALKGVTDKPSKESERRNRTWANFYAPVADNGTLHHIQQHHDYFFKHIAEVAGTLNRASNQIRLLEVGIGTGAFYARLHSEGYQVSAIDNDGNVIAQAARNLEPLGIIPHLNKMDALGLATCDKRYDIVYHQGLLEHCSDREIFNLLDAQLHVAPRVLISVPSIFYPTRDLGNERLMTLETWMRLLRSYNTQGWYYGGNGNRYHVLLDISRESRSRGFGTMRLMK